MSPYVSLLGKRVEVIYRAFGTMELLAVGTLLNFSDDYILIEQNFDRYGPIEPLPLVIRYSWIVRITEDDQPLRKVIEAL
jgi:hypothetical protein